MFPMDTKYLVQAFDELISKSPFFSDFEIGELPILVLRNLLARAQELKDKERMPEGGL